MATITTSDGVCLHYVDEGSGTVVVLIAGFAAPLTTWERQRQALRAEGYRVRGVVSVDQTPKMVNDDSWSYGFFGLDRANLGTFFADGIPATGRGLQADRMAGIGRGVAALGGRVPSFADARAPETRPLLQNHAEADWRDVVARCGRPSLFLVGRGSHFWPWEHAVAMAETNPLARSVVLDECGHAANIDQPDLVNAAILEFLS